MSDEKAWKDLDEVAWAHIRARRFDEAEVTLRELIERAEPRDPLRLWYLLGVLAGVLNNLERPVEAAEMYRRALAEARRSGASNSVETARYMLANQLLIHGNPTDALAEAEPIPAGRGHVQCLLRSVAAQALWKLGRHEDARSAAKRAIDAAPTDERRSDLTEELAHIQHAAPAVRMPTNHNSMEIPDERGPRRARARAREMAPRTRHARRRVLPVASSVGSRGVPMRVRVRQPEPRHRGPRVAEPRGHEDSVRA